MKETVENIKADSWFTYTSSTMTMKSWSEKITNFQEVPANFKNDFIYDQKKFPFTVYVPSQYISKNFRTEKVNSKLISIFDDHILIYENISKDIIITKCFLKDIVSLQLGCVLLRAWVKITSEKESYLINFNAAQEDYFFELIKKIRINLYKLLENKANDKNIEITKFDFLNKLDYKLKNYGVKSIINGEQVEKILYQENRTLKSLKIAKFTFYKKFIAPHLTILTDKELIIIKEEKDIQTNRDIPYSSVYNYIPLEKIKKITFSNAQYNGVIIVSLEIAENEQIQSYFSANIETVRDFFEQINEIFFKI